MKSKGLGTTDLEIQGKKDSEEERQWAVALCIFLIYLFMPSGNTLI